MKDAIYSSKLFLIQNNKEGENCSMSACLQFNGFVFLILHYSVHKTHGGREAWIFSITDINLKLKSAFTEINILISHHRGGLGS